jgi:hypothetical protein
MDEDEEVYARLAANNDAAKRIEANRHRAPVELILSLETVRAQALKVEALCAKMRARARAITEGSQAPPAAG